MRIYNYFKDFFISKEILYVDDEKLLNIIIKDIQSKKFLALDTEFVWRNTYYPKLSLIQVSTENKIYILDCLTLNISNMKGILSDEKVMKIFHSIRGDSSVLFNCLGIKLNNIFDTQIAEDLLTGSNGDQISYKKLVKKYFFKDISKSETNSDWEKRPLRKKQLDYAAEDVRYLHSIMRMQNKKLRNLNKLEVFQSNCEHEKSLGEEDFSKSRLRRFKKKNKNVSDKELKIYEWRENQAKKLNVPPNHIFEERNLKRLKHVLSNKNINELKWIIKIGPSREDFITHFSYDLSSLDN